MRNRLALLLAGALVLGACAQSDDASDDASATDAPAATASDGATEAGTGAPTAELSSADLPDGVAATVGDVEIATEDVEERLALVREIPQVQEQLEGDDTGQAEAQIQSQIVGQLVMQRVVLQGATEEGIDVDDERVAQDRSQLTEEAGGDEAFAEQLAQAGVPEGQLAEELRASIAFQLVTEKLLADAGVDPEDTATEGGTESATDPAAGQQAQQAQQDWLVELVSNADVVVDEEYGAWDPASGQVVPA